MKFRPYYGYKLKTLTLVKVTRKLGFGRGVITVFVAIPLTRDTEMVTCGSRSGAIPWQCINSPGFMGQVDQFTPCQTMRGRTLQLAGGGQRATHYVSGADGEREEVLEEERGVEVEDVVSEIFGR